MTNDQQQADTGAGGLPKVGETPRTPTLSGKQIPVSFASRHGECVKRLTAQESGREAQVKSNRSRFILALVLLMIWYLGGPFAPSAPLHFVIQAVGVFLVALGIGVLRVLQSMVPLRTQLASIRHELLTIEDNLGIDFKAGLGNPAAIASRLTPNARTELEKLYSNIAGQLAEVEGQVETSVIGVYFELFAALRTPPAQNAPAPVTRPTTKRGGGR